MIYRFNEFLNEEKKHVYSYGCVMAQLEYPKWKDDILSIIDNDDIYYGDEEDGDKYGLEDEAHVTLLYGIHADEVNVDDIKKFIENYKFETDEIEVNKIDFFEREQNDYDVVKFNLNGLDVFKDINKKLKDEFPYTTDFPRYNEHSTIAYVNKGTGKKYKQELEEPFKFKFKEIKYSYPDGDENKNITVKVKIEKPD